MSHKDLFESHVIVVFTKTEAKVGDPVILLASCVLSVTAGGEGRVCWDDQRRRCSAGRATGDGLCSSGGRHPLPHRQQCADLQCDWGGQSETGGLGGAAVQH